MSELFPTGIPSREQFQIRYGKSVLSEFVKSHDYNSLIDELVQNDYDAGSPESIIQFLEDRLVSTGFGNPIDEDGWKRLELVMGTDDDTPPKQGLLGVKNQGLRSLFKIGDFIIVKSNGCRTILSMQYGALKEREMDDSTKDSRGTTIEVPYRLKENNGLPVFNAEEETRLMQGLEKSLWLKIGMLSTSERLQVMNRVTIISLRANICLIGRQSAKTELFAPTITALKRSLSLEIRRGAK